MPPQALPTSPLPPSTPLDASAWVPGAAIWGITLWTAERAPLLVALTGQGVGLSPLGRIAQREWEDLHRRFPGIAQHDFAILPDRMRALLHVPRSHRIGTVGRMLRWFKASVQRAAAAAGSPHRAVWAPGFDGHLITNPEELWLWRRRIREGLSRFAPAVGGPGQLPGAAGRSGNGTSTTIPSRATLTSGNA